MNLFDEKIFNKSLWKGAYIVGGSVRDRLLGRTPFDFDVAVFGDAKKFAEHLATVTNGHWVEMGKQGQAVYRVVVDKMILDVSPVNGATIEEDLNRRDFTINAMAYDIASKAYIDCAGGIQDLKNHKIRMVSRSIFERDPLRLIRAYRMGAVFKFKIEPQTVAAIKTDAGLISKSAAERIRTELFKILETKTSHRYILQMAESGLLFAVLPELSSLMGCTQNRYHRFDVFEHTLKAYYHLENILENPTTYFPALGNQQNKWAQKDRAGLLKYCMLLHDIGKPVVKTTDRRGRIHFYGHGKKSADMAKRIHQRLKLSNQASEYTDFIIRNHIRPLFLFNAQQNRNITRKAIARFFMKCGSRTPDLWLHTLADIKGKGDEKDERNTAFIEFARKMITYYHSEYQSKKERPPLISGKDLINTFGLKPSPLFKKILKKVEEARLADSIHSKAEAEAWVKEYLARNKE
jgi:tRNA nucleotidyltransferase/poly(A) polymerase